MFCSQQTVFVHFSENYPAYKEAENTWLTSLCFHPLNILLCETCNMKSHRKNKETKLHIFFKVLIFERTPSVLCCAFTLQMQYLIGPEEAPGEGRGGQPVSPFHMEMSATRASLIPDTSWERREGWCFETDVLWHSELPHHVEWSPRWLLCTSFNYSYKVQTPRTSPQISYIDYVFQKCTNSVSSLSFIFSPVKWYNGLPTKSSISVPKTS